MKTNKISTIMLAVFLFTSFGCEREELEPNLDSQISYEKSANLKALAHTKQYDSEVATAWFSLLAEISKNTPYFNPQSIRLFSYSGLALYESVVIGMPSYQSFYTQLTGETIEYGKKKDYYWPASANAAISRLATRLLEDYPQQPNYSLIENLESGFNAGFAARLTSEQLERSNEFGRYVGDLIYEYSKTDGTFEPCDPYGLEGGPENWVPTPPFFFPPAGVCQGFLRTFIPDIAALAMPPAPPAYSTDPDSEFYKMNEEIYQLSFDLTSEDMVNNQQWRDIFVTNYNVPTHMVKLTSILVAKEKLNLEDASVLFAKEGMAMSDAIGAAFAAKFEYNLLRPVTYIHNVMGYSDWVGAYPAPQHPSYPAVAPSAVGAAITVLEEYFGTNYQFKDATQEDLYGIWEYDSFAELLENVGRSRTHSGINFKISVDAGMDLGRYIGEKVNELDFKK